MSEPTDFEVRNARGTIRFLCWVVTWVASMILVDKAVLYGWYTSPHISVLGIVINAALGLGVIRTFLQYLRAMDEMQRKIQLESLALAMGIGFVGSFSYSLLVTTGFIADVEISDITLLMCLTYMASVAFCHYRYR
ncbi:MAG TPA: hypothetical protein QGF95_22250 [Candidatus Latescibacteria bacterium]|nr:hypothetical protein [Candidatus Latescibacterota bacterium]HJP33278.1 hypothetical protein [Candidatus Latescibacterota bacterium]